jgi:hypothetical protein
LRHDRAAETILFGLRQDSIRRAAHVGQLDVVGACATRHYKERGGKQGEQFVAGSPIHA